MEKAQTKSKTKPDDVESLSGYLSPDERRAVGKALRDAAPRAAHGGWKPPKDRRDPIELLDESVKAGFRSSSRSASPAWRNRHSLSIAARPRSWRPICHNPGIRATGAGLRRRASHELRRLRHPGTQHLLRH